MLKTVVFQDPVCFLTPGYFIWPFHVIHDFGLWIACEAMRSQQEAAEAEEAQVSYVPVDVNPSALATVSEPSQVPMKGKNWGNCVVQNYRYEFIVSKCVLIRIFIFIT